VKGLQGESDKEEQGGHFINLIAHANAEMGEVVKVGEVEEVVNVGESGRAFFRVRFEEEAENVATDRTFFPSIRLM
jgi:hypothetical protein